jgi:hypothetical protein
MMEIELLQDVPSFGLKKGMIGRGINFDTMYYCDFDGTFCFMCSDKLIVRNFEDSY